MGSQEAQHSSTEKPEGRVVRFRQRGSTFNRPLPNQSPVRDLDQYERNAGPDDYRHRMIMNVAGFAVTVALIAGGIWIANSMAQMRKNQDCVLSGRNCTPIDVHTLTR